MVQPSTLPMLARFSHSVCELLALASFGERIVIVRSKTIRQVNKTGDPMDRSFVAGGGIEACAQRDASLLLLVRHLLLLVRHLFLLASCYY